MRLSEAIDALRVEIGDIGEKNWTDERIVQQIFNALKDIQVIARRANPSWGILYKQVSVTDLVSSIEGGVYTLPNYMARLDHVEYGSLGNKIPRRDPVLGGFAAGTGWFWGKEKPRTIVLQPNLTGTDSFQLTSSGTWWIAYEPHLPHPFKGKSNNPTPGQDATTWKVTQVELGKIHELENAYTGFQLAREHNGQWEIRTVLSNTNPTAGEADFTMQSSAYMELHDVIETVIPFPEMYEPFLEIAAYRILRAEGHQRALDRREPTFREAKMEVQMRAGEDNADGRMVEVAW